MITIILSKEDTIASLLRKINSEIDNKIQLILPADSILARSSINIKIIQKQAKTWGKELSWKSSHPATQKMLDHSTLEKIEIKPQKKSLNNAEENKVEGKSEILFKFENDKIDKSKNIIEDSKTYSQPVISQKEPSKVREVSKVVKKSKRKLLLFPLAAIIIGILAFYAIAPRADIKIYPKTQPFNSDVEVVLTEKPAQDEIAVRWLNVEVSVSTDINTTGTIEQGTKASGKVEFSNNYSSQSINVPAGAKLIGPEGQIYVLKEAVAVPGLTIKGSDKTPGIFEGQLEAEKIGVDYNIGINQLGIEYSGYESVMKDTFTASTQGLTGGESHMVSIFSDDDLKKLQEQAKTDINSEILNKTQPNLDTGEATIENGWITNNLTENASNKVGDESDLVSYTLKGEYLVPIYNPNDVLSKLKDKAYDKVGSEYQFINFPEITFKVSNVDKERKRLMLRWQTDLLVYKKMDTDNLLKEIKNMAPENVKNKIKDPKWGIADINIELWPFWVKTIPGNLNRVKIEFVQKPS